MTLSTNEHMQRNGQACHTFGKYMGMATGKPRECKACINKTKMGKK